MTRRKTGPTTFLCSNCGETFGKWFGKCPNCGEWNTLVEYREPGGPPGTRSAAGQRGGRGLGILARSRRGGRGSTFGEMGIASHGWLPQEREAGFESGVRRLGDVSSRGPRRIRCGIEEFDRVLGGGIVPGSVILVGGDPGVGKSTLLLQVASRLTEAGRGVLYVSGEESAPQLKLRAERLGVTPDLSVLGEADLELILEAVAEGVAPESPAKTLGASGDEAASDKKIAAEEQTATDKQIATDKQNAANKQTASDEQAAAGEIDATTESTRNRRVEVVFIDSIQATYLPTLPSAPGSVLQVREGAIALTHMAKTRNVTVFLVGHVTKEGHLAGPRTLEHIVDVVLAMEGERYHAHRLLRGVKNRFGSVHEIGVFDMRDDGLQEVRNPSQLFLGEGAGHGPGSVVLAGIEGTRSLLIEVQALVHPTRYGIPQRIATGFDGRRLAILLAVLLKRGPVDVTMSDVFINVAGGLRVDEPGVDLAVVLAIASSFTDRPIGDGVAVFGELGLGGEIRRVSDPERRIGEAVRLGYRRVMLPAVTERDLAARGWRRPQGCELVPVANLADALRVTIGPPTKNRRAPVPEE